MTRRGPAATLALLALLVTAAAGCSGGGASRDTAPAEVEGHFVADDGARIFYRRVGDGTGSVVIPADLYLHPALRGLADGRSVVFYDMRNRGRSDSVSAGQELSIQRDVEDLEQLRAHLGIERMDLVGWSYLGLMVAMYAAEHPDRVNRMVQIGPVPMRFGTRYPPGLGPADYVAAMDSAAVSDLQRMRAEGLHERDPEAYCEREWAVTRFTLVGNPALVDRAPAAPCAMPNEWPSRLSRHFERHFASVQQSPFARERAAQIRQPVLVIHGTLDRNAAYGAGREWAMTLPDARLLTLEGSAHCPWVEEPERVVASISTFLGGDWPEGVERVTTLERPPGADGKPAARAGGTP